MVPEEPMEEKKESEEQKEKKDSAVKKEDGSDIICMICFEGYEKGKDFAKAKCGHVACSTCWTQWLDNCLECPMCKQRTRLKQLTKLP